jgi:hypothetical protein
MPVAPSATNLDLESTPVAPRLYLCQCGRPIFFRNSFCISCSTPLGYDPERGMLYPLKLDPDSGTCTVATARSRNNTVYVQCQNLQTPAGCNWLIPSVPGQTGPTLCIACRLNRTIPDLSIPENNQRWWRIETAKRRLVSSLVRLGLPVASRLDEDPQRGLAFDFLGASEGSQPVLTGHDEGIITLNIIEAEHLQLEQIKEQMHEQYRTILGHLRHESGHYYWDRIVDGTPALDGFRQVFGDERPDYNLALEQHYKQGPPPDWQISFVSAYASSHPWEDWAETWAHYLHMVDTLDTAFSFGWVQDGGPMPFDGFNEDVLFTEEPTGIPSFLPLVNRWLQLTAVLNELSMSMGVDDFYPFVLSRAVITKLHLIHLIIQNHKNISPSVETNLPADVSTPK